MEEIIPGSEKDETHMFSDLDKATGTDTRRGKGWPVGPFPPMSLTRCGGLLRTEGTA